jgi:hypothetical protein
MVNYNKPNNEALQFAGKDFKLTHLRKKSPTWTSRIEAAVKPFLTQDKEQAFLTFSNVLMKQSNLSDYVDMLDDEHRYIITETQRQNKAFFLDLLNKGDSVMRLAKAYYIGNCLQLSILADSCGYKEIGMQVASLWISQELMGLEAYDGARRILYLIKHPNVAYTPCELYHKVEMQYAEELESLKPADVEKLNLPDWKLKLFWEIYNPAIDYGQYLTAELTEDLHISESLEPIEKVDVPYILDLLKEKTKLMKKSENGMLTSEEADNLKFISRFIQDTVKFTPAAGSKKVRFKSRVFKVSSENNNYACVAMSIKRILDSYPERRIETWIINKYLHYRNGKYIWEIPPQRAKHTPVA